ncbi:MerR family transcriptional regulator [Enterocloster clostridioformis]|nr:MerR family transcriptional regulator [Enterocloster clostridioformis]ANU48375.1 MerR family transcriptional regulator [Lachnoclostridium sp. YL32]NDO29374.1 MerR family transcriptional regulator [Enterocloster clostridioformis]OXE68919.1 MerR family transcriptional regulator [Enterocloster clostridioformis]
MYTMMQVCKEVGMTYQTLKFYCNEGLIPNVKRDQNNRRIFDDHNVAWIKSLGCLKNCGMSIQDMKTYLELCLKGPATIPERKQILSEKRLELLGKIDELHSAIGYIDQKQEFYDGVLSGEIPYISNLIPADSN